MFFLRGLYFSGFAVEAGLGFGCERRAAARVVAECIAARSEGALQEREYRRVKEWYFFCDDYSSPNLKLHCEQPTHS